MIAIWPSRARESPPFPARAIAASDHTLLKTATRHDTPFLVYVLHHCLFRSGSNRSLRAQAEGASGFFGLSVLENVERQGVAKQSTFFRQ